MLTRRRMNESINQSSLGFRSQDTILDFKLSNGQRSKHRGTKIQRGPRGVPRYTTHCAVHTAYPYPYGKCIHAFRITAKKIEWNGSSSNTPSESMGFFHSQPSVASHDRLFRGIFTSYMRRRPDFKIFFKVRRETMTMNPPPNRLFQIKLVRPEPPFDYFAPNLVGISPVMTQVADIKSKAV